MISSRRYRMAKEEYSIIEWKISKRYSYRPAPSYFLTHNISQFVSNTMMPKAIKVEAKLKELEAGRARCEVYLPKLK
jgi:hypothetical protein